MIRIVELKGDFAKDANFLIILFKAKSIYNIDDGYGNKESRKVNAQELFTCETEAEVIEVVESLPFDPSLHDRLKYSHLRHPNVKLTPVANVRDIPEYAIIKISGFLQAKQHVTLELSDAKV